MMLNKDEASVEMIIVWKLFYFVDVSVCSSFTIQSVVGVQGHQGLMTVCAFSLQNCSQEGKCVAAHSCYMKYSTNSVLLVGFGPCGEVELAWLTPNGCNMVLMMIMIIIALSMMFLLLL